jgi:MFS family permease
VIGNLVACDNWCRSWYFASHGTSLATAWIAMPTATNRAANRGEQLILASICLAAIVLPLSFSGGAVATPAISRDLGGSPVALTWITNAFMLSFGSLLMAAGTLADQFGRKRVFASGMALFVASSLALLFAPSVIWLDVLRAVQGVAAAAALASGSAALAQEFEGHARTRAFSMLGASFGVGLAFGPVLAGALIDAFGWRSIFMLIAVIGGMALLFGVPRMRETRDPHATGLDWPGAVTFTATLVLLTFGIIQGPDSGWTDLRCCSAPSWRLKRASRGRCSTCHCFDIHASSVCRCCRSARAIATSCWWWCCRFALLASTASTRCRRAC